MLAKSSALLGLVLASAVTYGGEVYRWTDENGQIHYGDSIPESQKRSAKTITLTNTTIPEPQRQEAESRLARDKSLLRQGAAPVASPSQSKAASRTTSARTTSPSTTSALTMSADERRRQCAEEWRMYNESYACFNPYRIKGGGVRPEGFQHCTQVKEPEQCR